ncbi:MAG: hypothetical protein ACI33S_02315 [Bacilli bacterium]
MKFKLEKSKDNMKLSYYKVNISGLKVQPINKVSGQSIKANEITIVDNNLINSYIKQRINKKMNKIVDFMVNIINDNDSDDDSGMVLDEVNRLKGIIEKKYKEFLVISDYRNYMNKLNIIEEEFQRNYRQKMYMNYLSGNYYEEELSSGRSR